MKQVWTLTGLMLLLGLSTIFAEEPAKACIGSSDDAVHIRIIYDNYQVDKNLKTDWGFGCLVEFQGHKLLFDAGRDAALYKKNATLLDIDPREIPTLFISHEHGDHTAGVPWITEVHPDINCYLPSPYVKQLQAEGTLPANYQAVPEPRHMYGPFYSTGDSFEAFREQGLVVKTANGGVLITGCGHPGAIPMVQVAERELGIEIHTVIGGLHLMQKSREEVEQLASTLKEMGVRQICPTHCTGDRSIAVLKDSFGEGYIAGGTGKEIVIK